MSLRFSVSKSVLLPLLVAALAAFSAPALAYDWQTVAPENAGFSVDLPGVPEHVFRNTKAAANYIWTYGGGKRKFMVMVGTTDFFGAAMDMDVTFRQFELGFLESIKGKETSSKRETVRGANGKQLPTAVFTYDTDNGWQGVLRMVLDGNTLYVTDMAWLKGYDASAVRKRIMASYQLLPRTRPPEPQAEDKE